MKYSSCHSDWTLFRKGMEIPLKTTHSPMDTKLFVIIFIKKTLYNVLTIYWSSGVWWTNSKCISWKSFLLIFLSFLKMANFHEKFSPFFLNTIFFDILKALYISRNFPWTIFVFSYTIFFIEKCLETRPKSVFKYTKSIFIYKKNSNETRNS